MNRNIIFYRARDNKCPIQEFLDSLPGKFAQKAVWILKLLEDLDFVPALYFKKLIGTKEIWEVRVNHGSNTCRILCFFSGNLNIVLTNGFMKKSQKIPKVEIQRAETFREDYIWRKENE